MADMIRIRGSTPELLRRRDGVVFGSPPEVVDSIYCLREQFGVDQILCQMDLGAMPREAVVSFRAAQAASCRGLVCSHQPTRTLRSEEEFHAVQPRP
jgi:hypothetical protein